MENLSTFALPLNNITLIEASAGTGKTHTIASLYLRLLLQVGEENFPHALTVQQILVVTYTKMATQELKERIRTRIHQTKLALERVLQTQDVSSFAEDEFLRDLIKLVQRQSSLELAIERLNLAEQDFDLASIFTIHSFCQQMLTRFAFNSGLPLNTEFQEQGESEKLQLQWVQEVWREYFYNQPIVVTKYLNETLREPDFLCKKIQNLIGKDLNVAPSSQALVGSDLKSWLKNIEQVLIRQNQVMQTFQTKWLAKREEFFAEINANAEKIKYFNHYATRIQKIFEIPQSLTPKLLEECLFKYFTSEGLNNQVKKGETIKLPQFCSEIDEFCEQMRLIYAKQEIYKAQLFYYVLQAVNEKRSKYKSTHTAKDFNDLLDLMEQALRGKKNHELAQLIRVTYPFAMIDEFQDTDPQQYFIFEQIYLKNSNSNQEENSQGELFNSLSPRGFLMIGDPKQSIYKFRGADIFSYFKATQDAQHKFTLNTNYRSKTELIKGINQLFSSNSFMYSSITFQNVQSSHQVGDFVLNGSVEPAFRAYYLEEEKEPAFAKCCALSIRNWLENSQNHQASVAGKALEAKHIGVLVQSAKQAKLIQTALSEQGIKSVYLSEKASIFETPLAEEILFILKACLNPHDENKILNAVASSLFNWQIQTLLEVKNNEQQWESLVNRFEGYQKTWFKSGILAMLHELLEGENLLAQSFNDLAGERNLTDYLHLAEILQKRSQLEENPYALVNWYEHQLIDGDWAKDEHKIRLESERDLVKIITVHKSKGLAYDLVWLPFVYAIGDKGSHSSNEPAFEVYFDEKEQQVLLDLEQTKLEEITQEKHAEQVRMLYVALTRAKYQVVMAFPQTWKSDKWQSLPYVLSEGNLENWVIESETAKSPKKSTSKENKPTINFLALMQAWQQKCGLQNFAIEPASQLVEFNHQFNLNLTPSKLVASEFVGEVEKNWRVASFSYLKRQQDYFNSTDNLMELREKHLESLLKTENLTPPLVDSVFDFPVFNFPRGAKIGVAIHSFLEQVDFQQPLDIQNSDTFAKLLNLSHKINLLDLRETNLEVQSAKVAELSYWLNHIFVTPLLPNSELCLQKITLSQRLNELDFLLPIKEDFDISAFNTLLEKYHHLPFQNLNVPEFKGMLQGFMDLVFEYQDKYYLMDYKSNFLGENFADYTSDNLQKVITAENYDWQYLFYTVALHRYLQRHLPNYNYSRHFGGVFYTFLRGMNGKDCSTGVFFHKPAVELILGLEELFNA